LARGGSQKDIPDMARIADFIKIHLPLAVLLTIGASLPAAKATPEEAEFYRHVAEQYMLAQFKPQDDLKVEVVASEISDNRNFGGKCEGYLTAELKGREIRQSSAVKLVCRKPNNKFTIIVPVSVRLLRPQLVASQAMAKGTIITQDMLKTIWTDSNSALAGIAGLEREAIGSRVKKDIKQGEPIHNNSFCLVCKGDLVSIEAKQGNLYLRTTGESLSDGNFNETVQVRNPKSKKVIKAKVSGGQTVEVVF
ncbi:MAG TPA: flagella basal body P-ring formation protein FlgA, partial [Succinivibrionaceae bacterium]|nr:flagella basal body P-ring formation protein FlgA [Succinivibrionaceae bacterium]